MTAKPKFVEPKSNPAPPSVNITTVSSTGTSSIKADSSGGAAWGDEDLDDFEV